MITNISSYERVMEAKIAELRAELDDKQKMLDQAQIAVLSSFEDCNALKRRLELVEAANTVDRETAYRIEQRFHNACAVVARALELLVTIPSGNAFYVRIEDVTKLLKQDL